MDLVYTGPNPRDLRGGALPLPEGWPALDHTEPDAAVAEAKVASGLYRAREGEGDAGEIIGGRKRRAAED